MSATSRLAETEEYLQRAFDYQESELAAARKRFTEKARDGNRSANIELDRIKAQQKTLARRREQALLQARREVELIEAGQVEMLASALIQPSTDPDDIKARDAEVERIAVEVAIAFEAAQGADVRDVSTPPKARLAGLTDYPGFDLLSRRASEERCVEVKGRVGVGEVELTENEWARACILRGRYWLYAVFDCGGRQPRLLRVQDPFAKLIAKSRRGVSIDYNDIVRSASE